jgi:lipopolysaccharide transport system ATP-binding protein
MRSNNDIVIRVKGLGKNYLVPQKHAAGESYHEPAWRDRLKEFFPGLLGANEHDYFWALRDISFEVRRGEVLGIIGENGSGKSTLLKILSGVTPPSEGHAELYGRVGALLEVGTGFHPDLTGRENIFFNGALLGMSHRDIRFRLNSIIKFSGISEFIDVPVKRYSSGMYVRLAYSVASLLESDILLLDEVLAVGDASFRTKSRENMKSRSRAGAAVLFVSHSMEQVRDICDQCIVLEHGRIVFAGTPEDATARHWREQMHIPQPEEIEAAKKQHIPVPDYSLKRDLRELPRYANSPGRYLSFVEVFDPDRPYAKEFRTGGKIGLRLKLTDTEELIGRELVIGLHLHTTVVKVATSINNMQSTGYTMPPGTTDVECIIDDLRLGSGEYSLAVDLSFYEPDKRQLSYLDALGHTIFIKVTDRYFFDLLGANDACGAVHRTNWHFKVAAGEKRVIERSAP